LVAVDNARLAFRTTCVALLPARRVPPNGSGGNFNWLIPGEGRSRRIPTDALASLAAFASLLSSVIAF